MLSLFCLFSISYGKYPRPPTSGIPVCTDPGLGYYLAETEPLGRGPGIVGF